MCPADTKNRAFRHVVTEFAENVHNLLPDDGNRVTGPQRLRLARHGQVFEGAVVGGNRLRSGFQLLDFGGGGLLQLVQDPAELPFHIFVHVPELLEQGRNFTLSAQETHACFFHLLLGLALEIVQLIEQRINLLFRYHIYLTFNYFCLMAACLAARFSRAFCSRPAPLFRYLAHWLSSSTRWKES